MTKQRKIMYGVFGVLFAFILLALGLIQMFTYRATPEAQETWNIAAFEQKNNWTHFEVTGEVYIISSQLNLPVLDNGTMATIVKEEHLDKVFVGGHSLGGVVSTIEAKKLNEMGQVAGLILLASYPDQSTDISETQIPVLSITASNDKILKQEKYEDAKSRLPESTLYTSIEGGNHSGFGLYGQQKGDGEATMSAEEQQKQLIQLIKQFIVTH